MVRLPQNEMQTYWLNSQGLKCHHQVWPWLWPWPSIFNVKYGISYISAKSGPIATKRKANISIELQASNVTNGFDLDHNLDLWIFKVKCDLDLWPHTWPWPWIFMVKFWNSSISEWEGGLTLHKGGGSRSFMTMTMTIWWPRSGAWIYEIVTGVTSVVGVLSTHLVLHPGNGLPVQCIIVNPSPLDKMAAILQMILSDAFSWMKMCEFQLTFYLSLFPRVQLTIFQYWLR